MPINQQEWFFESVGKAVDGALDKGKQKLKNTKETISHWIENSLAYIWKKAEQGKQMVKNWINSLGNTYRDVSDKVKTTMINVKEGAIKAIDDGKERATNKIKQLDWALKNLDKAIANWTLKAIKRSTKTWTMILEIGKERISYTIESVKKEINNIGNAINKKVIEGIAFAQEKGMLALKIGQDTIKVSIAAAIATGLVFYKGGKLMVDKTKLLAKNVAKDIRDTTKSIRKSVDQGIVEGKRAAADYLRNTADRIDPKYLAAER